MKTEIRFLEQLEEDLLDAARREGRGGATVTQHGGSLRSARRTKVRALAVAAAAFVALSGLVGYLVLRNDGTAQRQAALAPGSALRENPRFGAPDTSAGAGSRGAVAGPHAPAAVPSPAPAADQLAEIPPGSVPLIGPLIVKTADLSLTVPTGKFASVFGQAASVGSRFGGFVSSSSSAGTKAHSGQLTIRVPETYFDEALSALRALGRVDAQSISGEDVTAKYVDLNARLKTWTAQENALIRLMGKAVTVDETLKVQAQLQRVQLTIEELQGQLRVLADETANATISVSVAEQGAVAPATVTNPSLAGALKHAIAGFFGVLVAVVVGAGYLVPIAVFSLGVWLIARVVRRRRSAIA